MKFGIIDFMMALPQVALIVMKLCGAISWSWWLVLLPMLLIEVFYILVLLFYVYIKVHESHQAVWHRQQACHSFEKDAAKKGGNGEDKKK